MSVPNTYRTYSIHQQDFQIITWRAINALASTGEQLFIASILAFGQVLFHPDHLCLIQTDCVLFAWFEHPQSAAGYESMYRLLPSSHILQCSLHVSLFCNLSICGLVSLLVESGDYIELGMDEAVMVISSPLPISSVEAVTTDCLVRSSSTWSVYILS